ncbi:MAG: hypothetical protein ACXAC7_20955 [Candidatus Hodarchaeales archaeon]|jgi:hypothetical protein
MVSFFKKTKHIESRIILWDFDPSFGGKTLFSYPNKLPDDIFNITSGKVYSFLAMVSTELGKHEWAIIPLPRNRKGLNYAFYKKSWYIITLDVHESLSYWLLQFAVKLIPEIEKVINDYYSEFLTSDWDFTPLKNIYIQFEDYCKGLNALGIMDFSMLPT